MKGEADEDREKSRGIRQMDGRKERERGRKERDCSPHVVVGAALKERGPTLQATIKMNKKNEVS